jgi:hypothetical protein
MRHTRFPLKPGNQPSEKLSYVVHHYCSVGGVEHDGVIGDSEIVQFLRIPVVGLYEGRRLAASLLGTIDLGDTRSAVASTTFPCLRSMRPVSRRLRRDRSRAA